MCRSGVRTRYASRGTGGRCVLGSSAGIFQLGASQPFSYLSFYHFNQRIVVRLSRDGVVAALNEYVALRPMSLQIALVDIGQAYAAAKLTTG